MAIKKSGYTPNRLIIKIKHTGKNDVALKKARRYLLEILALKNNRDGVGC